MEKHGDEIQKIFEEYFQQVEEGGDLVLILNSNSIREILIKLMKIDPNIILPFRLDNGSVSKIRIFENGQKRVSFYGKNCLAENRKESQYFVPNAECQKIPEKVLETSGETSRDYQTMTLDFSSMILSIISGYALFNETFFL